MRQSLVPTPLFRLDSPEARSRYHTRIKVEINPVIQTRGRAWHVVYHSIRWLLRNVGLLLKRRYNSRNRGVITREFLEELGGLWIKPGQILASRRDILPGDFCEELSKLHEKVVGFPPEEAVRTIEEELRGPIEEFFSEFDHSPFAAASVGQLHRATLRENGVTVAVKVQRPNLAESFSQDMKFIRAFVRVMKAFNISPHIQWDEMAEELNKILTEEFDFRYEASNMTRMRKTLKKGRIYVPELFQRYCTRRVTVMEFVSGVSIADYIMAITEAPERLKEWRAENNVDPRRVGQRLFFSVYRQLLEDNLFHGDLHPGNILMLRDSRLAFLDFGTVGTLDAGFHKKYVMLQKALTEGDYSRAVDLLLLLFPPLPETLGQPRKEMIAVIQSHQTHAAIKEIPYTEKTASALVSKLTAVFFRYRIPAGMDFMRIDRTMLALDASLMHLCPHENMTKMMQRYWKKAARREQRRLARQYKQSANSGDMLSLLVEGPRRISEMMLLQGELLRGKARSLQDKVTKFSHFVGAVASVARAVIAVGVLVLVAAYLAQYHRDFAVRLMSEQTLQIADRVPHLDSFLWLVLLAFSVYTLLTVVLLRRKAAQPEAQDTPR